jgi:hypothetical protein
VFEPFEQWTQLGLGRPPPQFLQGGMDLMGQLLLIPAMLDAPPAAASRRQDQQSGHQPGSVSASRHAE